MSFFKKYRFGLLLVALALLLRIFLFIQIMHTTPYHDFFDYKEWIYRSYSLGLGKVYNPHFQSKYAPVNQPPGTIYILRGTYQTFLVTTKALSHFFHVNPGKDLWVNDILLPFFFRFPSILCDLLLGFLLYIFVKSKTNEKIGLIASAFFLFNPAIIYNSTIWGQIDSINNLFFYISLLFLINKKAFFSLLFLALSLYVKVSLLPLVPLYFLFAFFGGFFKRSVFIFSIIATLGIITLLNLPFFTNPLSFFSFAKQASGGQAQAITVNAFNFWWMILYPTLHTDIPLITTKFFGLPFGTWGNIVFGVFYLPILLKVFLWRKQLTPERVFLLFTIVAFTTFLFLPKMHERYLYPALPLLIAFVGLKKRYWILAIVLSILHFLNLYLVWNPNLFLFRGMESFIGSQPMMRLISLVTLCIFLFLYFKAFKSGVAQ